MQYNGAPPDNQPSLRFCCRPTLHRALDAGQLRQKLQVLLPTNEKEYDFLATESVDYPCSLQREFEMAVNISKAILLHVLGRNTPLKVLGLSCTMYQTIAMRCTIQLS